MKYRFGQLLPYLVDVLILFAILYLISLLATR